MQNNDTTQTKRIIKLLNFELRVSLARNVYRFHYTLLVRTKIRNLEGNQKFAHFHVHHSPMSY